MDVVACHFTRQNRQLVLLSCPTLSEKLFPADKSELLAVFG
jgi:hypothetical protein